MNGADRARVKGALSRGLLDLYYMRNRWYEPQSGRFLSEDPIGLAGGINPYVYSGDDPVNDRDPSGMGTKPTCDGLVFIVDGDEFPCDDFLLGAVDTWFWRNFGFGLADALNGTSGACTFSGGGSIACTAGSFAYGTQGGIKPRDFGLGVFRLHSDLFYGCTQVYQEIHDATMFFNTNRGPTTGVGTLKLNRGPVIAGLLFVGIGNPFYLYFAPYGGTISATIDNVGPSFRGTVHGFASCESGNGRFVMKGTATP